MTLVIYCIYPIKNKKQTVLRQTRIPIVDDSMILQRQFVTEVHHKNWFVETLARYTIHTHSRVCYETSKNSFDFTLKTLR